jgi:hypothetical protein
MKLKLRKLKCAHLDEEPRTRPRFGLLCFVFPSSSSFGLPFTALCVYCVALRQREG